MSVDSLTTPAATTFTGNKQGHKAKRNETSWRPGESGNPKGRPPEEESMSGILRQLAAMTPAEILEWLPASNPLGKAYADMPQRVPMRTLLMLRIIQSQMFDPNGVMAREIFDRLEGRVPFRAEVDGKLEVTGLDQLIERVYGEIVDGVVAEPEQLEAGE